MGAKFVITKRLYGKIIFVFLIFIMTFCSKPIDTMDAIADYHPDDKYFKAAMVGLHFITEVSPISKVDTAFKQMIQSFNLPIDASKARDGKYSASSPYDAYDYAHVVEIEVKDKKIISVDYNEIHREGHGKQEDKDYCLEMSSSGTSPDIAYPEMESQLLKEQKIMDVDAVSGASYSLYRFRYALILALMKAELASQTQ